ncbi:MAG: transposase [Acidobacteriota bacterium]|nr:transposase [Acidobacteriota bacterium]
MDFLLGEHRDIAAAKQFFAQAIKQHGSPAKLTVDGYPATHTAISELKAKEALPQSTQVRTSKYLKNLIEQDHRRVKQRLYPMLGFKNFRTAAVTISGIELVQIKKGQFNIAWFTDGGNVRVPEMWGAVLAA